MDVTIVEVSPRDGLQNESVILSTEAKVELIGRLVRAGARRVEAVSFAHPKLVPAMADAEAVMARLPRGDGVAYAGLVLNRRGLDRALAAGVDEVNVVVGVSDSFSRRNQNASTEESMAAAADVLGRAGVHTGEVQVRGEDVGGIAVHFAARVMAVAAPGEVLVSGTVRDLVAGSDYVLEDRGAHALKGIAGEWRLFAVKA